jgi:hypothetical protein
MSGLLTRIADRALASSGGGTTQRLLLPRPVSLFEPPERWLDVSSAEAAVDVEGSPVRQPPGRPGRSSGEARDSPEPEGQELAGADSPGSTSEPPRIDVPAARRPVTGHHPPGDAEPEDATAAAPEAGIRIVTGRDMQRLAAVHQSTPGLEPDGPAPASPSAGVTPHGGRTEAHAPGSSPRRPRGVMVRAAGPPLPEILSLPARRNGGGRDGRREPGLDATSAAEPVVRVTIGRVEVRATPETPAIRQAPSSTAPAAMSLEAYLDRRQRESRR